MRSLRRRVVLALLTCVVCITAGGMEVRADNIDALRDKINQAQQEKKATEDAKEATEANIGGLNSARNTLQGKLDGLTQDLTEISQHLEEIENNIIEKKEEISDTQEKLALAKQTEETQYEDMKRRLRYLYENKNQSYAEILIGAGSFGELINQSLYVEKLQAYDRRTLLQYKANREAIEELEAKLQEDLAGLDELKGQAEEEKSQISANVASTRSGIAGYSDQIAAAEDQADALADMIKQQEADISALQKQLAEEIAKSRLAAQSKWRDISEVTFSEEDRYLLANLIYCEAGNQPYDGQVAVGAVVINRVLSSVYPNTVSGVIYQYKQFAPVLDGHLALALAGNRATAACYRAADEAMSGYTNVGQCVYFRTPIPGLTGIQIGGHIFY